MAYTNSPLVSYTKISPNKTTNRIHAIDTITIHCVVGQCSVETLGEIFYPSSRQASSNAANDHRAVTIEVASDTTSPYAVNDKAYAALIDLVTDICQRNGIKKLVWSTDKNTRVNHLNGANMTVHRDYANKSCPGDCLYNRHGDIAAAVNARLGASGTTDTSTATTLYRVRKIWADSKTQIGAYKVLANAKKAADENAGYSVFDGDGNVVYAGSQTAADTGTSFTPYKVQVTITDLNIRTGPGTNYAKTGQFTGKGVFTIVDESSGAGSDKGWGKLKSGAGWISLEHCTKI